MTAPPPPSSPSPTLDSFTVPVDAGLSRSPLDDRHVLDFHLGQPVEAVCRMEGRRRRGLQLPGSFAVLPAGAMGTWMMSRPAHALIMRLTRGLFDEAGDAMGVSAGAAAIVPSIHVLDPHIERLGSLVRAERDEGYPGGRLYLDCLASAIVARLLALHARRPEPPARSSRGLPGRSLARVLEYIETHLDEDLGLDVLAQVAGFSASHFKVLFKRAVGTPVHQHVVERRVERARSLLLAGGLTMTDIALQSGFTHPSHMARCMRRVLGVSPAELARSSR